MLHRIAGIITLFIAALLIALPLQAAPEQGTHYTLISPAQATESGNKIEVVEFFSYGCPHCYKQEPLFSAWARKQPADVSIRHVPAIFNKKWEAYARIFYTVEALGALDKLHPAIFHATHAENLDLTNETTLKLWASKQGIDAQKFQDAYGSFAVLTKTQRAKQLTKAYAITGVPSVAIDGKFMTSASQAGGQEDLFPVLEALIVKARAERRGK